MEQNLEGKVRLLVRSRLIYRWLLALQVVEPLKVFFWSFGEPLTRLGEKWLGNPFTTFASLISAPSMADV
jgi:hypothetical protein